MMYIDIGKYLDTLSSMQKPHALPPSQAPMLTSLPPVPIWV